MELILFRSEKRRQTKYSICYHKTNEAPNRFKPRQTQIKMIHLHK